MKSVREVVQGYIRRGWMPVPIPSGQKGPRLQNWPSMCIAERDVPKYFNAGDNVGLLLGEPGGGLVDIDLDVREAAALACQFLPATGRKHGRKSKTSSHWWYVANPIPCFK